MSTALKFVQALRIATDTMRLSTVVSIYRAGEQLYKHFEKVCIIYKGRMTHFGRVDTAKASQYFQEIGYKPVTDSLMAVTEPAAPIFMLLSPPSCSTEFGQESIQEVAGSSERKNAYVSSAKAEFAMSGRKK